MFTTEQKLDLFFAFFAGYKIKAVENGINWTNKEEEAITVLTPSGIRHTFYFVDGKWEARTKILVVMGKDNL